MSVVADKDKEKEKTNAAPSLSSSTNNKGVSGNNIRPINRESVEFREECDRLENCAECQQLLKECLACRDDPTIKELLRQYKQLSGEQDHLRHRASPSPIQQRNRGIPTKQPYEQKQQPQQQQIQPYQQRRYSPLGRQNNYRNQRDYQQYHRRSPDGGSSKQIGNYKRQSRSSSPEDRMKYRSNNNPINRPPAQVPPPPADRKMIPSSSSSIQQQSKQTKNEQFRRNISRSPDSEHRNRNQQPSKQSGSNMNMGGTYSSRNTRPDQHSDYQGRYSMQQYPPKRYNNNSNKSQSRPRRAPSSDRSNSSRSRSRERQVIAKKSPRDSLRRTNTEFDRNKRSPRKEVSRRSESSSRSKSDSRQRDASKSKSKSKSKSRSRSYHKDRSERTSSHRRSSSSSSSRSSKSSSRRSSSSSRNSTNNNHDNNNLRHPNLDELQLQIDMQFSKKQQQL